MSHVAEIVTRAWREALLLSESMQAEDFFDAGGTSVTAITLMENVESALQIEFPIELLFTEGKLAPLVEECERRASLVHQQPAT